MLADAVALDQELVQAETSATTQETDASESTSSPSAVTHGAGGARLHAGSCDGQMPTVPGADRQGH